MKDALLYIISSIVENPENVEVEELEENGFVNFTVTVAKEDMGRVIGKEGKIIKAVRNVMKIPAMKKEKRIEISLKEIAE
ncbi:MAG: KH domain-containing protein [bacterium]|nr:KH domain-containing protein [bacterium]